MTKKRLAYWKKLLFSCVILLMLLGLVAALYLAFVAYRCRDFYGSHNRWAGIPYRIDGEYGYFPNSGPVSYQKIQRGEDIPVLFDGHGFRVPLEKPQSQEGRRPLILFLGCSFTLGYGVPAEKTFSYLAADKLGGCALNAGVSGWSYAQILIRARKQIPELKPDFVVLQYSPWLVNRAQKIYAPTNWAMAPVPYFFEDGGRLDIHGPVFASYNLSPLSSLGGEKISFLKFVWTIGLPLYFHDDLHGIATWLKELAHVLPIPSENRRMILKDVIGEIEDISRKNNAKFLVLKIFSNFDDDIDKDDISFLECPVADTYPVLLDRLADKSRKGWAKDYYIWRGSPPRLVDDHPNAQAHEIIADVIVKKIKDIDKGQTSR